jgi:hypothetical protein
MVVKMPIGHIAGIRGIYLNNFLEKDIVPAIEYINSSDNIPEYIFVADYFPAFYVLTNKKPSMPEDPEAVFLHPLFRKAMEGKKNYFCGIEINGFGGNNIDRIVLDRWIKTKPCIISTGKELTAPLSSFIRDNYYLAKKFTYKRTISLNEGVENPSISIYLPY